MFTTNPFAWITESAGSLVLQVYVLAMIAAVALGTLLDVWHKRSGEYFAGRRRRMKAQAQRQLGAGRVIGLAVATIAVEVVTAGEFCKWQRRVSHLLMAYGFVTYVVTTILMIFVYAAAPAPPIVPTLWTVGLIMILIGGLWFFFFLRVDVAYEKRSPFRLVRADLFIGSLIASSAFALAWHIAQTLHAAPAVIYVLLAFYVTFSTLLFGSVFWSKFAHMFYKPVMAFQKRVEEADGSTDLPAPAQTSNIRG